MGMDCLSATSVIPSLFQILLHFVFTIFFMYLLLQNIWCLFLNYALTMLAFLNSIPIIFLLRTNRPGSSSSTAQHMMVSTSSLLLHSPLLRRLFLANVPPLVNGTDDLAIPHSIWSLAYCTPTACLISPLLQTSLVQNALLLRHGSSPFLQAQHALLSL